MTLFDDLLARAFKKRLVDHLPVRVLPISAEPPRDIQLLIDEDHSQIQTLLMPGNRRRAEARGRIRVLLAMEAHVEEDTAVSKKDVDRIEAAVRSGRKRDVVFPHLGRAERMILVDARNHVRLERVTVDIVTPWSERTKSGPKAVAGVCVPGGTAAASRRAAARTTESAVRS